MGSKDYMGKDSGCSVCEPYLVAGIAEFMMRRQVYLCTTNL